MTRGANASPGVTDFGTRRRAALFDDLLALLLAEGFAHLSVADLAGRLRCSKTTIYTLADSKEQLVTKTVTHFFRVATEHVEARVAAATSHARRSSITSSPSARNSPRPPRCS